jgi:hypothetical protein
VKKAIGFVVGLSAVLLVALGTRWIPAHGHSASGELTRVHSGLTHSRNDGPFLFGKQMSLMEAQSEAGFSFLLPNDSIANESIVRAVYLEMRPGDPEGETPCAKFPETQAAIDYESGLIVTYELVG